MAAMIVCEPNDLDRLTKSVRNKLGKKRGGRELKFNNSMDSIRTMMLKGVANMDCQIVWIAFDKNSIPLNLREDKKRLYQMACEIVLGEAMKRTPAKEVYIMIDKRYPKRRGRDKLDQQIMSALRNSHAGYFFPEVRISQYDSYACSALQVHDFVVGAIYQHLERGVDTYISIIQSKIVLDGNIGEKWQPPAECCAEEHRRVPNTARDLPARNDMIVYANQCFPIVGHCLIPR